MKHSYHWILHLEYLYYLNDLFCVFLGEKSILTKVYTGSWGQCWRSSCGRLSQIGGAHWRPAIIKVCDQVVDTGSVDCIGHPTAEGVQKPQSFKANKCPVAVIYMYLWILQIGYVLCPLQSEIQGWKSLIKSNKITVSAIELSCHLSHFFG